MSWPWLTAPSITEWNLLRGQAAIKLSSGIETKRVDSSNISSWMWSSSLPIGRGWPSSSGLLKTKSKFSAKELIQPWFLCWRCLQRTCGSRKRPWGIYTTTPKMVSEHSWSVKRPLTTHSTETGKELTKMPSSLSITKIRKSGLPLLKSRTISTCSGPRQLRMSSKRKSVRPSAL